jgi:hypothetical protein
MIDAARVRELLIQVWGEQACQVNPKDWPAAFDRYMKDGKDRGSFKPFVDDAVPVLTSLANKPDTITPTEVWRAFSKLDKEHCAILAERLTNERNANT